MTTSAIVGAGRGLGGRSRPPLGPAGLRRRLLARRPEHVDELAAQLTAAGITARLATDVGDADSLTAALDRASVTLGPVEGPGDLAQRGRHLLHGGLDNEVVSGLANSLPFQGRPMSSWPPAGPHP